MVKKLFLSLIRIYQLLLSPDQGIFRYQGFQICRFYPSCSQYMYEAIEKYGFFVGFSKGARRILHCHPWHSGGYDPLN